MDAHTSRSCWPIPVRQYQSKLCGFICYRKPNLYLISTGALPKIRRFAFAIANPLRIEGRTSCNMSLPNQPATTDSSPWDWPSFLPGWDSGSSPTRYRRTEPAARITSTASTTVPTIGTATASAARRCPNRRADHQEAVQPLQPPRRRATTGTTGASTRARPGRRCNAIPANTLTTSSRSRKPTTPAHPVGRTHARGSLPTTAPISGAWKRASI